jgi:hypothetical protein
VVRRGLGGCGGAPRQVVGGWAERCELDGVWGCGAAGVVGGWAEVAWQVQWMGGGWAGLQQAGTMHWTWWVVLCRQLAAPKCQALSGPRWMPLMGKVRREVTWGSGPPRKRREDAGGSEEVKRATCKRAYCRGRVSVQYSKRGPGLQGRGWIWASTAVSEGQR